MVNPDWANLPLFDREGWERVHFGDVVDKLNEEWNGAVKVGKLDIDLNVNTTMQYGVMGVPTLMLFKGGQPVERLTGFMPKERILAKLNPHLS